MIATPSCYLVDLDDTLFSETEYVYSGYRVVATVLASHSGLSELEMLARLRYEFLKYGRIGAFDRLVRELGVRTLTVADLVVTYREHSPKIALYPGAKEALARLRQSAPIAIVTDGNGVTQRRKVEALALAEQVDAVVYCWELEAPKPSIEGYRRAAEQLGRPLERAFIVGDDPFHDIAVATTLGLPAARIRSGRLMTLDWPVAGVKDHASFASFVATELP